MWVSVASPSRPGVEPGGRAEKDTAPAMFNVIMEQDQRFGIRCVIVAAFLQEWQES